MALAVLAASTAKWAYISSASGARPNYPRSRTRRKGLPPVAES
jgi:hypothetical protein